MKDEDYQPLDAAEGFYRDKAVERFDEEMDRILIERWSKLGSMIIVGVLLLIYELFL